MDSTLQPMVSTSEPMVSTSSETMDSTSEPMDSTSEPMDSTSQSIESTSQPRDCESDPTFVMLDESDDEETIAEEESLEPEIDPQEELQILASDLNVSLEELKASSGSRRSRRNHKKVDYQAMLLEEQLKKKSEVVVLGQPKSLTDMCSKLVQDMEENNRAGPSTDYSDSYSVSELTKFYLTSTLNEDEEADEDYKPMLRPKFNRQIRTGPLYQAEVPEELCCSPDTDVQCSGDLLLWKPLILSEQVVKAFACEINTVVREALTAEKTRHRAHERDDEQALEILLRCNFNVQLALNIFKQNLANALYEVSLKNKRNNNKESNEQETNCSGGKMESKTNDSRENVGNKTNDSKEIVENKTNDSRESMHNGRDERRENVAHETNNEFPSPPKIPKQ